jgi:hypothetical protein
MMRLVFNLLLLFGCPFILAQSWLPGKIFGVRPLPTFSQVESQIAGPRLPASENLFLGITDFKTLLETAYQYSMGGLGMILIAFAAAVIWIKSAEVARNWSVESPGGSVVQRTPREGDPTNVLEAILRRPFQAADRASPAPGLSSRHSQFGRRSSAG